MAASAHDAHPFMIYNARFRAVFPLYDADGDLVPGASTPDTELSQDQGTFADATNEMTEIATSSGMYYIDLIATETDCKCLTIIAKSATAGMKTTPLVFYPVRLPVLRTGTAQAGAASTITLDSGASGVDDFYNGCYVNITNDTPSGVRGQARRIIDYVGSTKVATIEGSWGTNPSSSSTFEILATPEASSVVAWAGTPVVDPAAVGRPNTNLTHWKGTAPSDLISNRVDSNAQVVGDKTGYTLTTGERDSIAAALLDLANGVETSYTVRQTLRIMAAVLAGKASGGPGSSVFRNLPDSADRVAFTADSDGDRSAVTLTP